MVPAHGSRAAEPVYRPILACRRGELDALSHLDSTAAALVAPILEIGTIDRSTMDTIRRLPPGLLPAVDVSALPDTPATELGRWDVPLMPVIGLAESDHRLAAHGAAARAHGRRALVRLRAGQDRAGPDGSTTAVERVWRCTALAPEECDLLVDAGDVCCPADVRSAEPRVRRLLDWARRHAWRSVTVAAGGMPPTLSRLPTDEPIRLDRWDWQLWQRLADVGVDYGDYGVHPAVPGTGDPGDRLPTVRYTDDGSWWVYRWARRGGRSEERFADLCRTLVSAPHWPSTGAAFSWGDHELLRRARRGAGAGSAANWAAWSTSHHLAYVLATLSRRVAGLEDAGADEDALRPDEDIAPSWRPRPGPPQRGRTPR
ncbi:beta family protein [Micromonospora zamorensis]|uniref:beta family protein n=1 Tax=Micromonospora zamorensis TaxID=709883 RepID=UPI002E24D370